jgi:hypothetical protein
MHKHHQKCDSGGEAENDAHFELARVNMLLGKLGASNRTQAISQARTRALL